MTTYEKEHGKELGVGYSNFFSRDPFYNWQSLNRRKLKISTPSTRNFTIRPIIQQWTQEAEGYYFAAPQPDISEGALSEAGPFIEGGDVLVLGKQFLWATLAWQVT